jgi:hypothetical protein
MYGGQRLTSSPTNNTYKYANENGLIYVLYYTSNKIKVKLHLCLINQTPCHKDIWGSGGIALTFLTSPVDGDKWLSSRPCPFTPGETLHISSLTFYRYLKNRRGGLKEKIARSFLTNYIIYVRTACERSNIRCYDKLK